MTDATSTPNRLALEQFMLANGFPPSDPETRDASGLTPLMRAALSGRADIVDILLASGISANTRNADGNTAVWLACVGGSSAILRALVQAGADLNNLNLTGATTLMYTASAGKAAMVSELLALGADPHVTNQDGMKAVDMAATRECLSLLRHTIERSTVSRDTLTVR